MAKTPPTDKTSPTPRQPSGQGQMRPTESRAWLHIAAILCVPISLSAISGHPAQAAGQVVAFSQEARPGTVIVRTAERRLYLVLGSGQAIRYRVGVGRAGRQWAGTSVIEGKFLKPNWAPPAEIKRDRPGVPDMIPGGSPRNPLGAAAMTLSGGQYAIHGTNKPTSIGGFVSYGCIRMLNEDISDLYARVAVGSVVIVLP